MEKTVNPLRWWLATIFLIAFGEVAFGQVQPAVSDLAFNDSTRSIHFMLSGVSESPKPNDLQVVFPYNRSQSIHVSSPDSGNTAFRVEARLPQGVFPGQNLVDIWYRNKSIWKDTLIFPNTRPQADGQPVLLGVLPPGAFAGHSVTVTGKNFGDDLSKIYIWLCSEDGKPYDADFNPIPVTYLSSVDAAGEQQIRFVFPAIPSRSLHGEEVAPRWWLAREQRFWVFVNEQPSANAKGVNIVNDRYRGQVLLLTLALFVLLVGLLWLIFKGKDGGIKKWYLIVVDDATNQISLPKVQVLLWTFLLAFGYTYYALMHFLVLNQGNIPDFPGSLLVLLGVTTGGSLITYAQSKNTMTTKAIAPSWRDVVSDGGQISLTKLQLVVFTFITMAIYAKYLADPELVFVGMPEVPTNLLLLMGISQGGMIAGKAVESTPAAQSIESQAVATNIAAAPTPPTAETGTDTPPAQ